MTVIYSRPMHTDEEILKEAMYRSTSRWNLAWQLEAEAARLPFWKWHEKRLLRRRVEDLRASGDRLTDIWT